MNSLTPCPLDHQGELCGWGFRVRSACRSTQHVRTYLPAQRVYPGSPEFLNSAPCHAPQLRLQLCVLSLQLSKPKLEKGYVYCVAAAYKYRNRMRIIRSLFGV